MRPADDAAPLRSVTSPVLLLLLQGSLVPLQRRGLRQHL
jgi:hypothetical protein